jgi:hypothetical protein
MSEIDIHGTRATVSHMAVPDDGEQMLGVGLDDASGSIVISIADGMGNTMIAALDDEQLDAFADRLGHVIEKLNERLRAFPSTLQH